MTQCGAAEYTGQYKTDGRGLTAPILLALSCYAVYSVKSFPTPAAAVRTV
jgi:hypothetical protein